MSRWSNRFVSLGAISLVTACTSMPWHQDSAPAADAPSAAREMSAPGGGPAVGAGGTANAGGAPAVNGTADAAAAAANAAPVPPQAAAAYADALKFMMAGRTAEAELALKQLTLAYPQFAGPQVNLGIVYLQGARLPQAEAAFKAALERNPGNAVAGNELGIVERRMGKFAEAETAYQRTIAAEPGYAPAYLNLGVLYDLYLGQPRKALEQYEHYVQLAGENKQVAGWMVELRKRVGAPAPAPKKEPA